MGESLTLTRSLGDRCKVTQRCVGPGICDRYLIRLLGALYGYVYGPQGKGRGRRRP